MTKRSWLIPIVIVALNALAILLQWSSLPTLLPAHYDLQGNAGGTMPRSMLLLYLLVGVVVCLGAYLLAQRKQRFETGLVILSSGICLVLLLSTLVTLTSGTMPIFMLAEPVVLLAALLGCVLSVVRHRKNNA